MINDNDDIPVLQQFFVLLLNAVDASDDVDAFDLHSAIEESKREFNILKSLELTARTELVHFCIKNANSLTI